MAGKRRGSLRHRLLASFLIICLLPLFLTVFLVSLDSAKRLEKEAMQKASLHSAQIVSSLDSFTESYSNLTKVLAIDYEVISELNEEASSIYEQLNRNNTVRRLLMRIGMLRPDIRNVMLLTNTRHLYQYSSFSVSVDQETLLNQGWLADVFSDSADLVITPTHYTDYYETGKNGLAVSVARRIYSNNGKESGILIVDIDPYSLIRLSDTQKLEGMEDKLNITVRTADGGLVYDTAMSDGGAVLEQLLVGADLETVKTDDYVWKEYSTDHRLEVTVTVPWRSMMQVVWEMSIYVTIILIISIFLILFLSTKVAKRITTPVIELQHKMDEADKGNYSLMTVPKHDDEISSLVKHYDRMIETIQTLINEVYLREIKQKDAMLMALRSQINPHVLFNTLESIRMKAVVNGDMETAGMIKVLSKMFRAALDADPETSTIRSEYEYAVNYIEIQNIRFQDRFRFICRIPEDLMTVRVPPMIFQPILENSIEHGGRASHEKMDIVIDARIKDYELLLLFEDTGAGMTQEQMENLNRELRKISGGEIETVTGHERIALRNIAERVYIRYGAGWGLMVVDSSESGTTVSLRIPYPVSEEQNIGEEVKQ